LLKVFWIWICELHFGQEYLNSHPFRDGMDLWVGWSMVQPHSGQLPHGTGEPQI